jgi:hypothetical protein
MAPITRLIAPAVLVAFGFASTVWAQAVAPAPAVTFRAEGTWTGASKCTEQALLCDDQQIVIRVSKDANAGLYDVDFTTVVGGEETPDNHLVMAFSPDHHVLTAHFTDEHKRADVYFLAVKGDVMHGVLLVNDRLIERSLDLKRTNDTATPLPWLAAAGASSSSSSSSSSSQ